MDPTRPIGPTRPAAAIAGALVGALLLAAAPTAVADRDGSGREGVGQAQVEGVDPLGTEGRGWRPRNSSDGIAGEIAQPLAPSRLIGTSRRRRAWQVAPGVRARIWDQHDARGPVRAYLLSVDLTEPGLRLDYARRGPVDHVATVRDIVAKDEAIAGVNGDFYDINRTGSPLGTGLDLDRGLLHGRSATWNESFVIGRHGRPDIDTVPMVAGIVDHPRMSVTNLNSPFVAAGGIGLYTRAWGTAPGYLATQDQRRHVRAVQVEDGVVVSTSTRLPERGRVRGLLLVGRDRGARRLGRLAVGDRVAVRRHLEGRPRMAITGDRVLVRDGSVEVTDDTEMHPRTAIGIDRDTGTVLILAVDGRQDISRGYTMVELAQQMIDLGADEALNLDGGGSTTMVARRPSGTVDVVNSPSDGFERSVGDALELTYDPSP